MTPHHVVIVGATGQIGQPLSRHLKDLGQHVTVFSRDPDAAAITLPGMDAYVAWHPEHLSEACVTHLGLADAVIYLAGAPLFDGKRRDRAYVEAESHTRGVAMGAMVTALASLTYRPGVLVAASSVGVYGYGGLSDELFNEESPSGHDWWAGQSIAMERQALKATAIGVRTIVLRTGYVLTAKSLASQVDQFQHHAGGWIRPGRAWTPWIHLADVIALIAFAIADDRVEGALNATAPETLTNQEFARALGRVLGRHAWLPIPAFAVRIGLGVITDILTRGKRVIPAKAVAFGFRFRFANVDGALHDLLGPQATTNPNREVALVSGGGTTSGNLDPRS